MSYYLITAERPVRNSKSTITVKSPRIATDVSTTAVELFSSPFVGQAHLRNSFLVSPTNLEKRVKWPFDHRNPKMPSITAAQTIIAVLLKIFSLSIPPHQVAEGEGFEPPLGLHPKRFSRPPHSTALPPLRYTI
jgi:hypothetical protein